MPNLLKSASGPAFHRSTPARRAFRYRAAPQRIPGLAALALRAGSSGVEARGADDRRWLRRAAIAASALAQSTEVGHLPRAAGAVSQEGEPVGGRV